MGNGVLYPILQAHNPIFTSRQFIFTVFGACFLFQMQQIRSGKNSYKMIQKGSISLYRVYWGPPMGKWGPQWVMGVLYPILQAKNPIFTSFWACFGPKVANSKREKWYKNEKNEQPQWGPPMGLILPVYPILQANNPFLQAKSIVQPVFRMTQDDAPPQSWSSRPHPATGLFWARLSALGTPTNVFPTPLWSFWYQIYYNQTLLSILKFE